MNYPGNALRAVLQLGALLAWFDTPIKTIRHAHSRMVTRSVAH